MITSINFPNTVKNKPLLPNFAGSSPSPGNSDHQAKLKLGMGFEKFKADKRMADSFMGQAGQNVMRSQKNANLNPQRQTSSQFARKANYQQSPGYMDTIRDLKLNYTKRNPMAGKDGEVSVEQMLKEMKPFRPTDQEIQNFKHGIDAKNLHRHYKQDNLKQLMENDHFTSAEVAVTNSQSLIHNDQPIYQQHQKIPQVLDQKTGPIYMVKVENDSNSQLRQPKTASSKNSLIQTEDKANQNKTERRVGDKVSEQYQSYSQTPNVLGTSQSHKKNQSVNLNKRNTIIQEETGYESLNGNSNSNQYQNVVDRNMTLPHYAGKYRRDSAQSILEDDELLYDRVLPDSRHLPPLDNNIIDKILEPMEGIEDFLKDTPEQKTQKHFLALYHSKPNYRNRAALRNIMAQTKPTLPELRSTTNKGKNSSLQKAAGSVQEAPATSKSQTFANRADQQRRRVPEAKRKQKLPQGATDILFEDIHKHVSCIMQASKAINKKMRIADANHEIGEEVEVFGHKYNRYGKREENILRLRQQIYASKGLAPEDTQVSPRSNSG